MIENYLELIFGEEEHKRQAQMEFDWRVLDKQLDPYKVDDADTRDLLEEIFEEEKYGRASYYAGTDFRRNYILKECEETCQKLAEQAVWNDIPFSTVRYFMSLLEVRDLQCFAKHYIKCIYDKGFYDGYRKAEEQ